MNPALVAATLLATACLLTGCGEGESAEPIFSPTPTASTPAEPATSAAPEQEDPKDFIRHFVAAGDQMQATLDSSEYRSMFTNTCDNCKNFADLVDQIADAGGSINFEGTEILWIRGQAGEFRYRIRSGSTEYSEAEGSAPVHLAGSEVTNTAELVPSGNGWKVAYYAQVAGTAS